MLTSSARVEDLWDCIRPHQSQTCCLAAAWGKYGNSSTIGNILVAPSCLTILVSLEYTSERAVFMLSVYLGLRLSLEATLWCTHSHPALEMRTGWKLFATHVHEEMSRQCWCVSLAGAAAFSDTAASPTNAKLPRSKFFCSTISIAAGLPSPEPALRAANVTYPTTPATAAAATHQPGPTSQPASAQPVSNAKWIWSVNAAFAVFSESESWRLKASLCGPSFWSLDAVFLTVKLWPLLELRDDSSPLYSNQTWGHPCLILCLACSQIQSSAYAVWQDVGVIWWDWVKRYWIILTSSFAPWFSTSTLASSCGHVWLSIKHGPWSLRVEQRGQDANGPAIWCSVELSSKWAHVNPVVNGTTKEFKLGDNDDVTMSLNGDSIS